MPREFTGLAEGNRRYSTGNTVDARVPVLLIHEMQHPTERQPLPPQVPGIMHATQPSSNEPGHYQYPEGRVYRERNKCRGWRSVVPCSSTYNF